MKILFIEETDTISVTVPIILRKHGVTPNNIRWCRTPSHALPVLETESFDGIICASQFSCGEYGPRFLSEMYLSQLIKPGCVMLLFYDSTKDLNNWIQPELCYTIALKRPFNTKDLDTCIVKMCAWMEHAHHLPELIEKNSFSEAIYLIEDLQMQDESWQESLDRMKGKLLLYKQEYPWALQHYQQCQEEYNNTWVHQGIAHSMLWMEKNQDALNYTESLDKSEHASSYHENLFAINLVSHHYKECHKHIDRLLSIIPWQHQWHEWATFLQILMHNYDAALKYATEDHSHQLRRTSIRQHLKRFELHAILVMSHTFPTSKDRQSLYLEWKELEKALINVVSPQEQLLFKAQALCLNMEFEEARQVLNGLGNIDSNFPVHTLLYGWSICWLSALPKHAREFVQALSLKTEETQCDYVSYRMMQLLKKYMTQQSNQRIEHLKALHSKRNLAITQKDYPNALKHSIELFKHYPGFPGDALICIELLAVAWPQRMSSKDVEALLNQLCMVVKNHASLDDTQKSRLKKAEKRARQKINYRHSHPQ